MDKKSYVFIKNTKVNGEKETDGEKQRFRGDKER